MTGYAFFTQSQICIQKKKIAAYRQVPAATVFAPSSSFLHNGSGVKPDFTFLRDDFKIT